MGAVDGTVCSKRRVNRIALIVAGLSLFSVAVALLVTFGYENITVNDDEGTLTYVTQRMMTGAILYRDLLTIYGPLSFFYEWCAHAFGRLPVSLESVRVVSSVFWAGASLLVFRIVHRFSH